MNWKTVTLSQKELQRVEVISPCVQGILACASRAAERVRVLRLARTCYTGFNDHHLSEKLVEQEGFSLSRETLRRLLRSAGIGSPGKRRPPAHRQRRLRSAREGELVQLDGSPHDWLEGRGPHLTALYGDRSGIFVRNDDRWSVAKQVAGRQQPTQFGRALEQLGVTFLAAQSPQAKGRVERLWGVLQTFIADYNRRFASTPRDAAKAWRAAPDDLDRICCFVHPRIVTNDNVMQWEGQRLQIDLQPRRFSFAGAKVRLCQALDGRVSLYYGDTRLEHTTTAGG